ncbi:MAG: tRNA (adenosine(37)-N6)-threonylcarbamoyltransferase complex ATPase subunit type 1 TsaE, partial [Patescibacteria group bacterium]|nr:tRNA (adenosine(37)-N6)-threonylcarbamoyltransferase complex ATPase subunit type 1 TsaE [Patescibacteria group bacterium]
MNMISKSRSQTQKIAIRLAKKIVSDGVGKHARVLALIGDLGAGKTAFTQGFIKALGIKTHVPSPTFVIFRKYPLKSQGSKVKSQKFLKVYHFDLYRIQKPKEITRSFSFPPCASFTQIVFFGKYFFITS